MHTDVRYNSVGDLINSNSITSFEQIFDILPKTVLAKALKKNTSRMDDLIARPEDLRYKELKAISSFLKVPSSSLIRLFDKDFS